MTETKLKFTGDTSQVLRAFKEMETRMLASLANIESAFNGLSGEALDQALQANIQQLKELGEEFVATGRKANTAFAGTDEDLRKGANAADKFEKELEQLDKATVKSSKSVSGLRKAVGGLAGLFAGFSLAAFARSAGETAIRMESLSNAAQAVFETQEAATREMAFARAEADRLGQDVINLTDRYIKFSAAAKGTVLQGQAARDIFIGVSEAVTALGLSADDGNAALLALQQIISKGKVNAEELRQQFGRAPSWCRSDHGRGHRQVYGRA